MSKILKAWMQWSDPVRRLARFGKAAATPLATPHNGDDPLAILRGWMIEGRKLSLAMPDAMALASADKHGAPSVRMVLPKEVDDEGIVFYTHAASRKGRELLENPQASGCFYWDALARQVRIEGAVARLPDSVADAYFATRSRKSQIGAWVSKQSEPMASPDDLTKGVAQMTRQFAPDLKVPRPPEWAGFCLQAKRVEIWQGQAFRLHDRFEFNRTVHGWTVQRLWP